MQEQFTPGWCYLKIDGDGLIFHANERAVSVLGDLVDTESKITSVLPWFRRSWLREDSYPRLVKTSISEKILLDIVGDDQKAGSYHIFFRNFNDYHDSDHLWCEAGDSIIGVQRFIDTSYDGIVVADGSGKVLAINNAFEHISGLNRCEIVGRNFKDLLEDGSIPYSCSLQALIKCETISAVVKYPAGKEAVVSSTPLCDPLGRIVRVVSNVRDISELNTLHEKLKSVKDLAKGFQRELMAIQIASADINRALVRSRVMENLYELVMKVADTDLQLLITGESGVGKTALAKFVHMASERHNTGNFIHVNCSAIPDSLLESELFGYEEGSFTGAKKSKVGLFELANKGTLFLDEIGDMPLSLQAKILNVLQEGKFYRVGGTKEISVDVRIIAATNTKLEELIEKGAFRQDLYYRLNVIPIRIPPLAERKDDLPPLIAHYLDKTNQRYKRSKTIAPEAMETLLRYNWPGNIRELINLIERMVVIVDEPIIELRHLAEIAENSGLMKLIKVANKNNGLDGEKNRLWRRDVCLKDLIQSLEEEIIEEAIGECGSLKEASKNLGVDVTTIIRKRNRKDKKQCI
ncbi:MAG: sigma 54-interacting transcriptional regulator [Negativicutes bacterium]|nr:sigma 54-interacting transcriptional regulator [Negativicutes bacterium]